MEKFSFLSTEHPLSTAVRFSEDKVGSCYNEDLWYEQGRRKLSFDSFQNSELEDEMAAAAAGLYYRNER